MILLQFVGSPFQFSIHQLGPQNLKLDFYPCVGELSNLSA